jgi:hypothetical protein
MIRLAIRGYVEGHQQFEELVTLPDPAAVEHMIPVLATKHATALADHKLHMIEIEFLDEPNPLERFFRFGSDPRLMRCPIALDL